MTYYRPIQKRNAKRKAAGPLPSNILRATTTSERLRRYTAHGYACVCARVCVLVCVRVCMYMWVCVNVCV